MASIYTRPKSRFWWVKFRSPATGKIVRESTGIDASLPGAKRKALAIEAEKTRIEMTTPKIKTGERFDEWGEAYFRGRYKVKGTLDSALTSLEAVIEFVLAKQALSPRQVTYEIAGAFVPWLKQKKGLHHNTARLRNIYFSVLMSEAVRRGIAPFNPFREIKVGSEPPKEKEEISVEDQAIIEAALKDKKEWMREQWLILMRQGCRIEETRVPMERINEEEMTITLRIKRGKMHIQQLHPDLLPLVRKARAEGRKTLVEGFRNASPMWSHFFNELGMPYSIHCTRVTVITRLLRANHPIAKVIAFIGHTEAVNVIYRRLKAPDTQSLLDTLGGASTRSEDSGTPQNPVAYPRPQERAGASSGPVPDA